MSAAREPKRWEVLRYVCDMQPYRVFLSHEHQRLLEMKYLEFVRNPKHRTEIDAMLAEGTDCPEQLIPALRMTLYQGLFLAHRTGRGGRLVDSNVQMQVGGWQRMEQTTDLGAAWLAAQQEVQPSQQGVE